MLRLWNETNAKPQTWYRKQLDGCVSSNGKPYSITLKKGTVNKLLVNFLGGGASWNEETARVPISIRSMNGFYISHIAPIFLNMGHVGLFAPDDTRSPFHDWYILNIPYSSADFHLGDSDFHYQNDNGKPAILHHHGRKNVEAALGVLTEFFSETPNILAISGVSAGGFGALAHSPAIQSLYPDCENILLYTEGAHLPSQKWPAIMRNVWNISPDLAAYMNSDDPVFDLFRYAQDHMPPHTRFLHSVSVWDEMLARFMHKMKHDEMIITPQTLQEFHESLIHTVKKLKQNIPNYAYYLTDYGKKKDGTTPHIFSGTPKLLYSEMQDGMPLATWISQAFETQPADIGSKFLN